MTTFQPDMFVRRATMADREAVLSIDDNVLDGRDYLPCYYENLISMDTTIAYVVVLDGKIVGFALYNIVDGGRRADVRSGRIHVQYRKLGIIYKMQDFFLSDFPLKQQPTTTFCVMNANPALRYARKIIVTRPFYLFEPFMMSDLNLPSHHTSTQSMPTLDPVTDDAWAQYMTDFTFSRYLFPNRGLVIDRVFFSLMVSNIPLMRKTGGRQLMLTDCRRGSDGTSQGLLTVSSWFENRTSCCNLDLFGSDLTSLQHHIAAHLKFGASLYPDKPVISLIVDFENTVDVTVFDKMLRDILLKRKIFRDKQGIENTTRCIAESGDTPDQLAKSKL